MSIRTRLGGRGEIAALSTGSAVGYMGAVVMPFWVAGLPAAGLMSQAATGRLASAEMVATAAANVAVSALGRRLDPRRTAAAGAALAAVANLVAALGPGAASLAAGRIGSGLGFGVLLAMVTAGAARQARPQHVLSTLQFALLPFLAIVALVSPALILSGGVRLLFALVAVCSLAAAAAGFGFPSGPGEAHDGGAAVPAGGRAAAPVIAGLATAAFFAAQAVVTTYLVALGSRAGLGVQAVGTLISATLVLNLAAPVAARWLGERAGLARPIMAAILVLMADVLLLAAVPAAPAFGASLLVLYLCPVFILPYQFALLARLDPTSRYAAAGPAFVMFGGAAGPAIGASFMARGAFLNLGFASVAVLALSLAGFALALHLARERAPVPKPQNRSLSVAP